MKIIVSSILVALLFVSCSTDGDSTYVQEAPLVTDTPTNGTSIIVSTETEAVVSYTNVSEGSILVSCGDDCDLEVYEATKTDATDCPAGFVWCPIEKKCIPEN